MGDAGSRKGPVWVLSRLDLPRPDHEPAGSGRVVLRGSAPEKPKVGDPAPFTSHPCNVCSTCFIQYTCAQLYMYMYQRQQVAHGTSCLSACMSV